MTNEYFVLAQGEIEIDEDDNFEELLMRQIPDHSWDTNYGQPGSTSFGPMPVDQGKPSFSRSSITTAQASRDWHNNNARSRSNGVWACSVTEVVKTGTRAVDDCRTPLGAEEKRAPGHAYVDYRHMEKKEKKLVRSQLLMDALRRGELQTNN